MGMGSRGEAGSETHRRKLCLEIKFGTCHELEERKAAVTGLGHGLQEEKAWDFIPSRR